MVCIRQARPCRRRCARGCATQQREQTAGSHKHMFLSFHGFTHSLLSGFRSKLPFFVLHSLSFISHQRRKARLHYGLIYSWDQAPCVFHIHFLPIIALKVHLSIPPKQWDAQRKKRESEAMASRTSSTRPSTATKKPKPGDKVQVSTRTSALVRHYDAEWHGCAWGGHARGDNDVVGGGVNVLRCCYFFAETCIVLIESLKYT